MKRLRIINPINSNANRQFEKRSDLTSKLLQLVKDFDGKVGVSAIHSASGQSFSINGDEPFPMASTVKIALAIAVLRLVQDNQMRLATRRILRDTDVRPGGLLDKNREQIGKLFSVEQLVHLTLEHSDNTATDMLFEMIGGPQAVTEILKSFNILDITVDRTMKDLLFEQGGVRFELRKENMLLDDWRRVLPMVTKEEEEAAALEYLRGPKDKVTPREMTNLLSMLWNGQLLNPQLTALMLSMMKRCKTGDNRMRRLLPSSVNVVNKTGTCKYVANDVGIIFAQQAHQSLILAIYTSQSPAPLIVREQFLAETASLLYQRYFVNDETSLDSEIVSDAMLA